VASLHLLQLCNNSGTHQQPWFCYVQWRWRLVGR
jgi:hypothetical protein